MLFKSTVWKVVAKIMQFLSQAAARNAGLRNGGDWKSVLKPAPQRAAVFIFRYLSKASSERFNCPQQEVVVVLWVSISERQDPE